MYDIELAKVIKDRYWTDKPGNCGWCRFGKDNRYYRHEILTCGALFFHEKNLKSKAVDLFLVLLGMIFLYLGTC